MPGRTGTDRRNRARDIMGTLPIWANRPPNGAEAALVRDALALEHMELSGPWRAHTADDILRRAFPLEEFDDGGWPEVQVPGHWRDQTEFADDDGPLLYRTRFEAKSPSPDRRTWLEFEGVFYQGDVWLDGKYVGDTEGYFFGHLLEVTDRLRQRNDHLLAVEVACPPTPSSGESSGPKNCVVRPHLKHIQ